MGVHEVVTISPEHSTCPKWAAQEARRIALEEAAALCQRYGVHADKKGDVHGSLMAFDLCDAISALSEAGK